MDKEDTGKLGDMISGFVSQGTFSISDMDKVEELLVSLGYHKLDKSEQQLEKTLKKEGKRTPASDLFRELSNPEFRYLYVKAAKSSDGQLVALARKTLIKEGYVKLDEEKVAQKLYTFDLGYGWESSLTHIKYLDRARLIIKEE
uniref:Uncharacterized protein n=1 Tax=viral metagenome TaxID=1070528 RepID=A0A6M3J6Z8_9ZZZZ